ARGRPVCPGSRGGAGAHRCASKRKRATTVASGRTAARKSKAAYARSPTLTSSRSGGQRWTRRMSWRAQRVSGLKRRPPRRAYRWEGAKALRDGSAQVVPAQGMGTSGCRQIQRRPLTVTKWEGLERTGSREIAAAAIVEPRRRPGRLIDADDEWTCRSKRRDQQPEQDAADAHARPDGPVHYPVVRLERAQLAQAHRSQG